MRWASLLVLLVAAGCLDEPTIARPFCAEDGDCQTDETCVVDLSQGASYCAPLCTRDDDCPSFQRCHTGVPSKRSEEPLVSVCVDLVRACAEVELCNGLDDDCDGVIDGASCKPITPCLDDAPCGLFVCSAPKNQAAALCVSPNEARVEDYAKCTADTDCKNGVCEIGRCAPLCRPPMGADGGCSGARVCAAGVGPGGRPPFNQCQTMCVGPMDCTEPGEICAWRDVFQGGGDHHAVCATPDPARKPHGTFCANRSPEVDDECRGGLCFGQICTRICGGPGADCEDVISGGRCCLTKLQYGVSNEYFRYVCVEGGSPCG